MGNFKFIFLGLPVVLAACGGGGGSGGDTALAYSISVKAAKSQLPVNVAGEQPSIGAYAPYTTTVYVNATEGGRPIIGSTEDIFGCNIEGGLDSAALYYLDGSEKDIDPETKAHKAYRSITLGSNSGGNSFHVHSGSLAGSVKVTCSVTDPRDKRVYSDTVAIAIGGASTNTPASVVTRWISNPSNPVKYTFIGNQGNLHNLATSAVMQAEVFNDNNQPVSSTGKNNIQVSIVPTGYANDASSGASLMAGGVTAQSLLLGSNFGNAQFSVSSGQKTGFIMIQTIADRADNDVTNGVQEPIKHLYAVSVLDQVPGDTPPVVDATQLDGVEIQNGQPFSFPLLATGGQTPYTWTLGSALPNGLTLTSNGILQGTPSVQKPGTYYVTVIVTDATGASTTLRLPLTIVGEIPPTPVALVIDGCSGNANTICAISGGFVGSSYSYGFSASGGGTLKWTFEGLPGWLSSSSNGSTGMLFSGDKLTCKDVGSYKFFVTVENATNKVTRQISLNVLDDGSCVVTTPPAAL